MKITAELHNLRVELDIARRADAAAGNNKRKLEKHGQRVTEIKLKIERLLRKGQDHEENQSQPRDKGITCADGALLREEG